MTAGTKVRLRQKEIANEKLSLYLDFYPPVQHPETGKPTRREFLKIHLLKKPKTYLEKEQNKELRLLAENIAAKRQIDITKGEFGFLTNESQLKTNFIEYFSDLCELKGKTTSTSNYSNWKSTLKHLKECWGDHQSVSDITPELCNQFKYHLQEKLSQNSGHSYFLKFREAINRAVDEGFLTKNPLSKIKIIPAAETKREFLTLEELRKLAETECDINWLKPAALFTALTGVRFVDIQKLYEFDSKSKLQEITMREFKVIPKYNAEELENGEFKVEVSVNGVSLATMQLNSKKKAEKILQAWLETEFTNEERHARRLNKIRKYEER